MGLNYRRNDITTECLVKFISISRLVGNALQVVSGDGIISSNEIITSSIAIFGKSMIIPRLSGLQYSIYALMQSAPGLPTYHTATAPDGNKPDPMVSQPV